MIINCKPDSTPAGKGGNLGCSEYFGLGDTTKFPEAGHSLAPWVAIDFIDWTTNEDGPYAAITVSNWSSLSTDPKNAAVIKSFSLGGSDGTEAKVTIHDTQGGCFEEFMKHIYGDWMCLKNQENSTKVKMKLQFGWAKNDCGNALKKNASHCYELFVHHIDANYSDGKFVFDIIAHDLCAVSFQGGVALELGGTGDKGMHLLHAIHKLWCDSAPPNIAKITFKLSVGGSNQTYTYDPNKLNKPDAPPIPKLFDADNEAEQQFGRKGMYIVQSQDKMAATMRWVAESKSINGRPWDIKYNADGDEAPGGELQFWEIERPMCFDESDEYFNSMSIGSFIVNGSSSSPVIEFNPKFNWQFAVLAAAGGTTSRDELNSTKEEGSKHPGEQCMPAENVEGAGQITQIVKSENDIDQGKTGKEVAETEALHKKGLKIDNFSKISADLVIVGDPNFWPPNASRSKFITIVMINPFHLIPKGDNGEWLAYPPCNAILSNKGWQVLSVNHSIDAGKFVTTIGVELAAPGVDTPAGQRLGGWNKGWQPRAVCV